MPRWTPDPRSGDEGWTDVRVSWLDEPERGDRIVKGTCRRCIPTGIIPLYVSIVSPSGLAHESERGDTTDCGYDCTGPEWWHRL